MEPEIAIAAISAIAAIVAGFFKLLAEIHSTHKLVNSRMTELLELTRRSSRAEGRLAGRESGEGRLDPSGAIQQADQAGFGGAPD
jgi:hypothetical protein